MEMVYDIIIVGAGISGLMAARELSRSKNVLIIEANDRIGGRINTISDKEFSQPVEEGAEFVHGKLPFTLQLLKEAGIHYTKVEGAFFQHKNGTLQEQDDLIFGNEKMFSALSRLEHDMSVYDFLQQHFGEEQYAEMRKSVTKFIEGYEAADVRKASVLAMREDLIEDDPTQYRIEGGYSTLVAYLYQQCLKAGCTFRLPEQVTEIHWENKSVKIKTNIGTYEAKKILVTVPLSMLQGDNKETRIKFYPALTEKHLAFEKLGAGQVIKILLEFKAAFWRDKDIQKKLNADTSEMLFLFSDQAIPTWWTQYPVQNNMLTGWLAGSGVEAFKDADDNFILAQALGSLSVIFAISEDDLAKRLKAWHVANWQNYPFVHCAYSYATVNSESAKKELNRPEAGVLFFAGEAAYIGNSTGTVEAALTSAVNATKELLNSFI